MIRSYTMTESTSSIVISTVAQRNGEIYNNKLQSKSISNLLA
ncbi:hypothetical protein SAMN04488511_12926 [Pedobacter suwonensis]|uniref:Uncharacterized protein n=1 Tax=Pedobacter suwonensis TaxID=332999 RepID=A0A1I0U9J1_9SPHI|nr:hypothetical protein SAMN04488511_12926 [Pedobacter suwonensis]